MIILFKKRFTTLFLLLFIFLAACEPLVTDFDETEDGTIYSARSKTTIPAQIDKLKIMTWNIRFGAGRLPWFGDSCGDRVILSEKEVETNLEGVAVAINSIQPDILIINEIDVESKGRPISTRCAGC